MRFNVVKADSEESLVVVFVRNSEGRLVSTTKLTREEVLNIAEALLNPPPPNEALQRAAQRRYDMIASESEEVK